MRHLPLLALVAACHDPGVTVHNLAPEAAILNPVDGTTLIAEAPQLIVGTISDDITPEDELQVAWSSSLDGSLNGEEVRAGSAVSLSLDRGLSVGEHVLSLQVVDEYGKHGEATRSVTVVENQGPVIELLEPQPEDAFDAGTAIPVLAEVSDDLDANEDLILSLTSSEDGLLSVTPEFNGRLVSFTLPEGLSVGTHALELLAYDSLGASGSATVSPVYVVPNEPPVIEILSPAEDEVLRERDSLLVVARFTDDRDAPGEVGLSWSGTALSTLTSEALPDHPDTNGDVEARLILDGCDNHSSNDWEWLIEVEARDSEGAYTTLTRRFFIGCQY